MSRDIFSSPFLLLVITVILIFWAEVVVMIFISLLPPLTVITEAFVDSLLLSLIAVPIFYLLLLRPIQVHIRQRRKVEDELRDHRLQLEEVVKERTSELMKSNEQLKSEIEKRGEAEQALKARMKELEDFYNLSVGRELKMKELKEEVIRLRSELSRYRK
jgi:C4-dicarboxylate-specific signal transduction histidine kinase